MQSLTPGRLMEMGHMILRYVKICFYIDYSFIKKNRHFDSMNQERNLIVEGDSIQLKMVHTPSVQWCEWLIILLLTSENLMIYIGQSHILSRMMVLSGKCSRSSEGTRTVLLTCTFASMFVTLLFAPPLL